MGGLRVLGSKRSFFSTRVEWALKLKRVDYEYIHEDVMNKSPMLIHYNPIHKKIPVLVLSDDVAIAESLMILEYIDEVWKENPILPTDPYERAMARFWAKFNDDKCVVGVWNAAWAEGEEKQKAINTAKESLSYLEQLIQGKKFFNGENIGYLDLAIAWAEGEEKQKAINTAKESLSYLEQLIQGKKFFNGENIGYLDLAIGWVSIGISALDEAGEMNLLDHFPSLNEWAQNFYQIELIKECLPTREEMVEHFKASISYMRSLK